MGDLNVANKEQAEKCAQIAERALASGDRDKAARFFRKAHAMYPSETLAARLRAAESPSPASSSSPKPQPKPAPRPSASSASSSASSSSSSSSSSSKNSSPRSAGGGSGGAPSSSPTHTPAQAKEVRRVLAAKTHYEVLCVDKDADEDVVKRSYRKLALKLHPDKNRAPKADEAFKMVSTAFSCLTDPERREVYDRYGTEEPTPGFGMRHRGGGGGGGGGGMHFSRDPTPEDLFNMFFGGGMGGPGGPFFHAQRRGGARHPHHHHQQQHQHRRGHQNGQNRGPQAERGALDSVVSLLPLLLLLLFTLLGSGSGEASAGAEPFSLRRTQEHTVQVQTALGVPYYVADDFTERARRIVEPKVHRHAKREYFYVCQKEVTNKNKMLARAKTDKQRKKAQDKPTPHCDVYHNLVKHGV